jgi:ornithine cyclodeaminase
MAGATAGNPLWLKEADVASLIDLTAAIAAVERGLALENGGDAQTMEKTHLGWGARHSLHAIGAQMASDGLVGSKTWAHTAGGATPLLILWDASSGRLRAVIEAFALGQLRTAAVSGVATRWLASPGASELAVIGSGAQAMPQVAAVAAVRPLRRVRVFSPTPARRASFATHLASAGFGFEVSEAPSVAQAVAGCPIITTVTRAREAFLTAAMVDADAHVNAIGAISPERREIAGDLVRACALLVADSPSSARRLSAELSDAREIVALSRIVGERRARPSGQRTLFKAMGIGLADVALGAEVLRRAAERGVGQPFPHPERVAPRLREGP